MSNFKFIHTADLHLDSPFKGIRDVAQQYSAEIMSSTFRAFDQVIEYCIELGVDFLLISGDIFDSENRSLRAEIYFAKGMERLEKARINVYLIHGNHDPLISKQNIYNWASNVHTFPTDAVTRAIYPVDGERIAQIYGRSYPERAFFENSLPAFAAVHEGKNFSIALHHTNVDGNRDYDSYAPTTLREIKSTKYDYWALGHIHRKTILNEREPMVIYPGNTQGRHINERGIKECHYVEVVDGEIAKSKWLPTAQIVWEQIELDITNLTRLDELINMIDEAVVEQKEFYQLPLIMRILLKGRSELYLTLLRQEQLIELEDSLNEHYNNLKQWVIIESIQTDLKPRIELEQIIAGDSFLADYLKQYEQHDFNVVNEESELFKNRSFRKHFQSLTEIDWNEIEEFTRAYAIDSLHEEADE
jgi:DNA repair exonuclease SbcCD nuclease subunit